MNDQSAKKRRPGIPHETLAYVVEQAGGTVEHYLCRRETWVRLKVGDRIIAEAANNTALLVVLLKNYLEGKNV